VIFSCEVTLKSKIYKRRHPDINSSTEAVTAECALITERQLASVRNASFYNRLGYCLFQKGELFEYFIVILFFFGIVIFSKNL
jgi:hypothetical protein